MAEKLPIEYVVLKAKPDTWFVEGIEAWHYDEDRRLTRAEWEHWTHYGICLVRGIRELDSSIPYEKEMLERCYNRFRIDGESCGCCEFKVSYKTENDGSDVIKKLKEMCYENGN